MFDDAFTVRSDFAGVFHFYAILDLIAPCNKLYIELGLIQSIAEEERLNAGVPTAPLWIKG